MKKQNRTSNKAASASSDSDDIRQKQNRTPNEAASPVPSSDSDDKQKQTKKHEKLWVGNKTRGRREWLNTKCQKPKTIRSVTPSMDPNKDKAVNIKSGKCLKKRQGIGTCNIHPS